MGIITRESKGEPLTHQEMDDNLKQIPGGSTSPLKWLSNTLALTLSNWTTFKIVAEGESDATLQLISNNNENTDWSIKNDWSDNNGLDFRFNNTTKLKVFEDEFNTYVNINLNGNVIKDTDSNVALSFLGDYTYLHGPIDSLVSIKGDSGYASLRFISNGNHDTDWMMLNNHNDDNKLELQFNGEDRVKIDNTGNMDLSNNGSFNSGFFEDILDDTIINIPLNGKKSGILLIQVGTREDDYPSTLTTMVRFDAGLSSGIALLNEIGSWGYHSDMSSTTIGDYVDGKPSITVDDGRDNIQFINRIGSSVSISITFLG
jgi:hypothetical protein